jgi:Acyltransferase family
VIDATLALMSLLPRDPHRARALDPVEETPSDRNRVVDLVRVLALGVVVLGHWVMQGIFVTDQGVLERDGLLQLAPWSHPLTWALQVMPLFFLVGGFVNALSWRHARDAGTTYGAWLASRTRRLTRPLLPLLAFWVVAAGGAHHVGLGADWLRVAGKASLVPTWFLGVYVVVVALVPLTWALWERFRLRSVLAGAVVAGLVDIVSLRLEGDPGTFVGGLNLLVVWSCVHQVGYAWQDGALSGAGRRAVLLLGGLGGAVVLVLLGPYGVSMVGVSGFGVDNAAPPRVTLLLVGFAQAGAVLLAEPLLARLASRRGVWRATALVGSRMMTIYLWHLTAFGIVAGGFLLLDGIGLSPVPNTADWWWSRPGWFVVLAVVTGLLVLAVGRFEPAGTRSVNHGTRPLLPLVEVLATCLFVGLLASEGVLREDGTGEWGLPLLGLLVLGALNARLASAHR